MEGRSAAAGKRKFEHPQQQQRQQQQRKRQRLSGGTTAASQQCHRLSTLLSQTRSIKELQQLVEQHCTGLTAINLAAAYTRLGKLCQGDAAVAKTATAQQLLQQLDKLLPPLLQQLRARELSNIIWGCAHAQHPSVINQLLPAFLQQVAASAANPQDISNVMWALANRWPLSENMLDRQQLQQVVASFISQVDAAIPQGISNVLWAVATMERQLPAEQCTALVAALVQKLDRANPQAIANSLWAVGKVGQQVSEQQMQLLLVALCSQLRKANPQHISNSLLGVAYMGQQVCQQHLQQLLEAVVSKLSTANTQDVSNTLWAVAVMKQCVPDQQLQPMLAHLSRQLHTAAPQGLSNSLWACAKFGYVPTQLLAALEQQEQQTQALVAAAIPQHLANMAWACGQLGYKGKLLLSALLQQASVLLQQGRRSFNCQDLCNLCWAVAVLDMQQHIPFVLQLARATTDMWDNVGSQDFYQLYQVHLRLQDCQLPAGGAGLAGVLTQQQLEECRNSWEQDLAASTAVSKASGLQQSVFTTLQQLPATTWQQLPVMEQRTADGAFSIDIAAVTAAGVALAIEVDGPSHFVRPGNRLNGPTQYRNRALAAQGYTVISIPHWEWNRLSNQQQVQYVKNALQQCSCVPNTVTRLRRRLRRNY